MPISGKYNFQGIKEKGALGIKLALSSTGWGAAFLKVPLSTTVLEFVTNWLANKGLIVMNLGTYYVGGELDQAALDKAIDAGIRAIESGEQMSPERIKEIDDAVIKAADKALPYGRKPKS